MAVASAPGKIIVLGEHAVVFGQPALALAIDLRISCRTTPSKSYLLNKAPLSERTHPYIFSAVQRAWAGGPLDIETSTEFPSGSGMGSSAAVTVACLASLISASGEAIEERGIADQAFEVESQVQGRASPIDTSVSAHGGGILVTNKPGDGLLWHIQKDTREWFVHDCEVPQLSLVVGFTGINAPTGPQVAKVKRYSDHTTFARDIIKEIGQLTLEGVRCLKVGDVQGLGELMTRDHKLLAILGVSHPRLDKLVQASLPYSYGAKLTGAGGGGSMIALTDRPDKVVEAIRMKGGTPFRVRTGQPGVRIDQG
jgi:mevalonate kinase